MNFLSSAKVHDLLEIEHNRTTWERERERDSLQENKEREKEATSQLKASNHQLMEPKKHFEDLLFIT